MLSRVGGTGLGECYKLRRMFSWLVVTGLIVVVLAEDAPSAVSPTSAAAVTPADSKADAEPSKRDSDKGNVLIHGSPPTNYILQPADPAQQVSVLYCSHMCKYYDLICMSNRNTHVNTILVFRLHTK